MFFDVKFEYYSVGILFNIIDTFYDVIDRPYTVVEF